MSQYRLLSIKFPYNILYSDAVFTTDNPFVIPQELKIGSKKEKGINGWYVIKGGIVLKNVLQIVIVAIGGFLGYFLGGFDGLLYTLVIIVIMDYVTALISSIINKKLSSDIGAKSILRKILIFLLVGIANVIEMNLLNQIYGLRTTTICFYILNESISVLENVSEAGLPVPDKLKNILAKLNQENKSNTLINLSKYRK